MAEESLKNKTVRGVLWSGADNIARYGVSFVISIILARLLTPDDYGLIGLTAIFTAICTQIINGGFKDALIRKKDATEDDYNTAFLLNLIISIILYVVIFICSPYIADFFNRVELISLVRVSSLGMIIGAIATVQRTKLTKLLDFKTQTKVTFIASIISGVIGIIMAIKGMGVWALVVQGLSSEIIVTSLFIYYNKWFPSLHFSMSSFDELFGFGWKMMASGILNTIWIELYQVVVGKYYSPSTLGQYSRANGFSQLLSNNLTIVVQRVTYPVLSNIQDEKERMVLAYRRIIKTTMFITSISMFFLGSISGPLIYCLIGPKWNEAATYLPLICISASAYPLHAINLNMLEVQGRSDLFLGLEIVKKIILIFPLFVGAFIGIIPMLYTNILTCIIFFFLNSHYSGKLIGYSSWNQVKDIAPSYAIATIVALSVYFLKYLPLTNWIVLPLQLLLGSTVFGIMCHYSKQQEFITIKEFVNPILIKLKGERHD